MVWAQSCTSSFTQMAEERLSRSQTEGYGKLSENRNAESLAASLAHNSLCCTHGAAQSTQPLLSRGAILQPPPN